MDIKSSFTYDSKIANEAYAAKAGALMAKENKLATGQKVSDSSSDAAASLQIKSRMNEAALENINAHRRTSRQMQSQSYWDRIEIRFLGLFRKWEGPFLLN